MCAKLKSELEVFYVNDGNLGGDWEVVINNVRMIEEEVSNLGLRLNRSKSELICFDYTTRENVLQPYQGFVWSILSKQSFWGLLCGMPLLLVFV